MGVYERCDTKAPSGSPMYVNHNAGDDTKPKRYLYRADASTHGGARDGLWIACNDEGEMAKNLGLIRSVQADAELPTAAGLTWIQAEGLVVTEVRPGARRCALARSVHPRSLVACAVPPTPTTRITCRAKSPGWRGSRVSRRG